jgi:hypothetical protein
LPPAGAAQGRPMAMIEPACDRRASTPSIDRSIDRSIQTLYTMESFAYRVFHFPLCSQSAVYIRLVIRFALNHVWCSRSRAVSSQACAR